MNKIITFCSDTDYITLEIVGDDCIVSVGHGPVTDDDSRGMLISRADTETIFNAFVKEIQGESKEAS